MKTSESLKRDIDAAPKKPGVYQYFDSKGKILYVGKAKVLKNRVLSYFNGDKGKNGKTRILVSKIASIKYIITESELDALLLENNLIKKHQPRYNVLLKDDKTYPWICIKKEPFPRVFSTRLIIKDGSEYYGPYASVSMMNTVIELVRKNYKLRTCAYHLSKQNIDKGKFKICLEYHIGNCKGPCEGLQSEAEYLQSIDEIRDILKGNVNRVRAELKKAMQNAAAELDFELAEELKNKGEALTKFQSRSTVVSPTIHNVDVFSIVEDRDLAYVNYMKVNNGAIIQGHTLELKKKLDESKSELLEIAITELRERFKSSSTEVLIPFLPEFEVEGLSFHVPQRGDKKKLLDLSERNAKYFMLERRKQHQKTDPERHTNRILQTIKDDLRLKELPIHIECFDNSNIQGSNPVAACVVFKNAKPSKKDYRHFNIKTVEGPDDFASMEEVVYRRYSRLLKEGEPLPQLIVIDGGKGQLSSALKSLEKLGLRGKIAIVGIAKRLEEIFYPGDKYPLFLDKTSESLKVIQHLRNEAHRFGITHHRNKRSKAGIQTELSNIDGIGDKTIQDLLRKFKSVKRIKEASLEELTEHIPESRAKAILAYFKKTA
ncbi:MAG: excinuclease ABC subunit UvrC [Bacteroidetes bacterium]|nr:MAG: excinuclease ABC subunit UvrC [Bacteroidota bacterium]MBL1143750.1 excinuclease ABC subunit UvrC [Bacteroidota bacterium]MCB0802601.1 excinuclease ABC subunit UvrC [Flavobacteriales bacterium]NOG56551.1 excinuclease ABC subunit UvrC [Bacteroidota bacterium]